MSRETDLQKCVVIYKDTPHACVSPQTDIRCVRKENEKTGAEKRDLNTKIDELNLVDEILEKDLKKICLKKQVLINNHIQYNHN